jgi:hypothetical protein
MLFVRYVTWLADSQIECAIRFKIWRAFSGRLVDSVCVSGHFAFSQNNTRLSASFGGWRYSVHWVD